MFYYFSPLLEYKFHDDIDCYFLLYPLNVALHCASQVSTNDRWTNVELTNCEGRSFSCFLVYKTGGSWKVQKILLVQLESSSLQQKNVWRTLKANTFMLELTGGVADTEAESKEANKRRNALEGCKTQKTNKLRDATPSLSLYSQLSNFAQPAKVVAYT